MMPASVAACGHRQIVQRLAVEGLGGGGDAIAALAEEDHVQVGGEDLFLGEVLFHAVGDEHLRELAAQRLVQGQEHVARGLLRDGAAALAARSAVATFMTMARATPIQSTPWCSKKRSSSAASTA